MSRDSEDYDVQAAEETEMLTDPAYLAHAARLEGKADYKDGIDILDGFRKLRARAATQGEIDAYLHGQSLGKLEEILRENAPSLYDIEAEAVPCR